MFKNIVWIFAIYTILVRGDMLYETDNYDGWIPISNDQALNIRIPDYPSHFKYDISETNADDNIYFRGETITIVTPQPPLPKQEDYKYPETFRNIKIKNNLDCNTNGVTVCPEETENIRTKVQTTLPVQFISPNKNVRRAKKLTESDFNNDASDSSSTVIKEVLTTTKIYDEYIIPAESVRKVYEVTENPESTYAKAEESEISENLGYIYDSPKPIPSPNKLNYVDLLSKILLKYNIDTEDQLQNYALSKQNKNRNILMPLMNVPRGFNSLNHLPVDPLLAVFLSNYGHYLPGVYGIEGNYKNLYGYLASNNIHNNRPFGLYKITSDTDSSSLI